MTKAFFARTRIDLADSGAMIAALCEHMTEHGAQVETRGPMQILHVAGSKAQFSPEGDTVRIDVSAPDLEAIYFLRRAIASHIAEFAEDRTPALRWSGDGSDLSRPPNFRLFEVVAIRDVTPRMRRITLLGEDVARYAPMDALHVHLLIQHPELTEPQWPTVAANGLLRWEDDERRPKLRKYTVRSIDEAASTINIDFVLHPDAGPGAGLAETATIGDEIGIMGPGGGGLVDADWYLFIGDETALPAITRMLEALPAGASGKAVIEVADECEIQPLQCAGQIHTTWLPRDRAQAGEAGLLPEAVRALAFPDEEGTSRYVWAGCEFDDFKKIRNHLRNDRGLKKDEHLVVSYWRRGCSGD
ncbi:MAG: DUF2218 domain-containing protein [Methyloligella sp. ZOD6]